MIFLHFYLWIAPHILIGLCLLLLFRARLQKRNPIFVTYLSLESILFLSGVLENQLFARHLMSLDFYQWFAVIGNGMLSVLELTVFYELANELVPSRRFFSATLRPLLRWAAAVLLLVVAVSSALLSQWGLRRVVSAFQTLELSANMVQTGLLLTLLLFTRAFRISWSSLAAGIALGLGIASSTEIAAAALLSALGNHYYFRIDTMRMAGFHVSVLVWLTYICLPNKRTGFTGHGPGEADLKGWGRRIAKNGAVMTPLFVAEVVGRRRRS